MVQPGSRANVDKLAFFEPIKGEMAQVEENLRKVSQEGFPHLSRLLEKSLLGSGKRVRPAITLLASHFHERDSHNPVLMATATELLHIASLIHDDTVDEAPIRRGQPTISSTFSKREAVLVGDYVFARSATFVSDTGNVRAVRRFSEAIMALSSGELREIATAFEWRQAAENYWQRIADKTASLFAMGAENGALLSGAPEATMQGFRAYGHNLGIAFQIVDDILDYEGDAAEVGKPVGGDLLQGTLTLPAILLMERKPDANPIAAICQDKDREANVKSALQAVAALGIISDCYKVAEEYVTRAREALAPLPDIPARRSLLMLADYVLVRRK